MTSPFGGGAFGAGASGGGGGGGAFGGGFSQATNPFGAGSTGVFGAAAPSSGVFGAAASTSTSPWRASTPASAHHNGSTSTLPGAPSSVFGSFATPASTSAAPPASAFANIPQPRQLDRRPPASSVATPPPPRDPNQISTLEVLGEDSDARKQRFESSLANNRYLELKPLREAQRLRDIKNGLIPDPLKPMRLDQATDFLGTCQDMCPAWEREEREYQNNVDALERYPGTTRIDPARAVKAFHRPAAGNEQPLPSDVRPPRVLKKTLDYLFHHLLPTAPLHVTHPFLRDRTRSIRQDLTMQNIRGEEAIECNERIARYHVLALGTLREQSSFSESQELEQLRKVLKSLNEFYDDARLANPPIPAPNEAEFRAYNILTHLRDPDIIWSCELLPPRVFDEPRLQIALRLHALVQRSNIPRGERASLNAASRFFKLLANQEVPYLFGCILSTHFDQIRKNALETMKNAYMQQHSGFPARTLVKVLGCDDEEEIESICSQLGIGAKKDESGELVVMLHKAAVIKNVTLQQRVSQRLVEAKRGTTTYQAVIDGADYVSAAVQTLPSASSPAVSRAPAAPAPKRPAPTPAAPPTLLTSAPQVPPFDIIKPALVEHKVPSFQTSTPLAFSSAQALPSTTPSTPSLNPVAPLFVPTFAANPKAAASALNPFASASTASAASAFAPRPQPSAFFAPPPQRTAPKQESGQFPAPKAFSFESAPQPAPVVEPRKAAEPSPASKPSPEVVKSAPTKPKSVQAPVLLPKSPSPPKLAKVDQGPLIASLSKIFVDELLASAARSCAQHAAEQALEDYWDTIAHDEQRTMEYVAAKLAADLLEGHARRVTASELVRAKRQRRMTRNVWNSWRLRTMLSLDAKERDRERRKRFEENVREITASVGVGRTAWDQGEDYSFDGALDLSTLSLGLPDLDAPSAPSVQADRAFADQIYTAQARRDKLWRSGTMLHTLAQHVDSLVPTQQATRQAWAALVSTTSTTSTFATWLARKFDLSDLELTSTIDMPHVDLLVEMVAHEDDPRQETLDDVGLILLDCTEELAASDLYAACQRVHQLVEAANEVSRFNPSLLITCCPSTTLTLEEQVELKQKLLDELNINALWDGLQAVDVWIARLDDAEEDFDQLIRTTLPNLAIRVDRAKRPLIDFVAPLLRSWSDARAFALSQRCSTDDPITACNILLSSLSLILSSAKKTAIANSPFHPIESLPLLSTTASMSFRNRIQSYVSDKRLKLLGPSPLLNSALSEFPPVTDATLARLLFDHLENRVLSSVEGCFIQQDTYDYELRRTHARLAEHLFTLPRDDDELSSEPIKENIAIASTTLTSKQKGKRKASASPEVALSKNKKTVLELNGTTPSTTVDRLSALEKIMKEAKGLLTMGGGSLETGSNSSRVSIV
ncbi:BZ3500_MvSof-1268-A1-R1_Chr10-1g02666 [Microbotryum saponariae]|uniref:BZ3500_MvSof-1268-A1-R1_Chr10-1g02666 protein n=1 Tax=Microbotryum saponariae TaxID=289078 RepID=A0A2X0L9P5_9BASI|nr:BZ3500_MvSof-1268-A1-R1_Chr10-1g02666 [Microbotryum saponariae]SDA06155.1 BZ3501_MvSof-1269-A2-R1_Chr10-1g02267 [Microbotryum saponariae]